MPKLFSGNLCLEAFLFRMRGGPPGLGWSGVPLPGGSAVGFQSGLMERRKTAFEHWYRFLAGRRQGLPLTFGSGATTGTSYVALATLATFQPGNDNVTFALPLPASSGTRTGPWNRLPQQRAFNL
jgi:hypothetical protein